MLASAGDAHMPPRHAHAHTHASEPAPTAPLPELPPPMLPPPMPPPATRCRHPWLPPTHALASRARAQRRHTSQALPNLKSCERGGEQDMRRQRSVARARGAGRMHRIHAPQASSVPPWRAQRPKIFDVGGFQAISCAPRAPADGQHASCSQAGVAARAVLRGSGAGDAVLSWRRTW